MENGLKTSGFFYLSSVRDVLRIGPISPLYNLTGTDLACASILIKQTVTAHQAKQPERRQISRESPPRIREPEQNLPV